KINYNQNPKKIDVAILGKLINDEEIYKYNQALNRLDVDTTILHFRNEEEGLKEAILSEINNQDAVLSEKDITINHLRNELNKYTINDDKIQEEIKILFPNYKNVSLGKIEQYPNTDSANIQLIVLYNSSANTSSSE